MMTKKMAIRAGMKLSEDGKGYFDERGNEWAFNCFFCGRPVRSGIDICWKYDRAKAHLAND